MVGWEKSWFICYMFQVSAQVLLPCKGGIGQDDGESIAFPLLVRFRFGEVDQGKVVVRAVLNMLVGEGGGV